MTKYVIDLPDNVSFIVGKGYVLFNEKEFLRIPVKQLEKYSKKEDGEVEKDEEIVYDGRNEEYESEKYVVSQEFMTELEEWKAELNINGKYYVDDENIYELPSAIRNWWKEDNRSVEQNNRLIAIIRWVNGEDVFEVEKPKKWVVRSKKTDTEGSHLYVNLTNTLAIPDITTLFGLDNATKFDTKEEAQEWANSHQEVVELEE